MATSRTRSPWLRPVDAAVPGPSVLSYAVLPRELIAEIFLHYIGEATSHLYPPYIPAPLLLAQVCSTWRRIVYGTPMLWTNFSLRSIGKVRKRTVDHISFAQAWLARAHGCPLSVWLSIDAPIKVLGRIMDVILQRAHHLQVIKFDLPYSYFQPLADVAAGSMPLLESMDITVQFSNSTQEQTAALAERITAFLETPRLRSVALCSTRVGFFSSNIQMPWSQLTKLVVSEDATPAHICRDAFRQCTNLVECRILSMAVFGDVLPVVPVVVLPHLRILEIMVTGPGDPLPFFQLLNLPALKDLTLSMFTDGPWSHQIFMEFILRSCLDLEQLSLTVANMNSDELLEIISRMHSLVRAEHTPNAHDLLFDTLRYHGMDSQHYIPKLTTLNILQDSGDHNDHIGLASMIESRWWTDDDDTPRNVSRLETVKLFFADDYIDTRVKDRLERCRREGFILDVT